MGVFPYLTERKIRSAIDELVDSGYVRKGNYSTDKMKKTNWYSLTEKSLALFKENDQPLDKMTNDWSKCPTKDIINKDNKNVLPELETMKIDVKNIDEVTSYTGLKSNDDIESIVVSVPLITAQAYSVAIVKVKDNADVEKIKQEMLDNIDMGRWICVSAEQLYITNSGNIIFSVMADKDVAKAVYNDFKKYVNNNIGKELEKSNNEENIELPPEMPAAE